MTKSKCKIDFINSWTLSYQGAESKIYRGFHENRACIAKYRFQKKFRHPLLDKKLTKERTKRERRMIEKVISKSDYLGPYMPRVMWSDDCTIFMTEVEGSQSACDYIISNNLKADSKDMMTLCQSIGKCIAELHNIGIIHGDLTTMNLLLKEKEPTESTKRIKLETSDTSDLDYELPSKEYIVIPIDFGLATGSFHAEERAVDLYVLERALLSTHFSENSIFNQIFEVYLSNIDEITCAPPGKHKILERLREVRSRGRKAEMKDEYSG